MRIMVNGESRAFPDGTTVEGLLKALAGAPRGAVAVEVNREIVPRARHAAHVLKDGDQVEIVTFVGGG